MQQGCRGHLPGPGTRSLMNHAPDTHLRYGGELLLLGASPRGLGAGLRAEWGCPWAPRRLSGSAPWICGTVLSHGFSPARSHFFWPIG